MFKLCVFRRSAQSIDRPADWFMPIARCVEHRSERRRDYAVTRLSRSLCGERYGVTETHCKLAIATYLPCTDYLIHNGARSCGCSH